MPYQHEGLCPRHESVQKWIDPRSCVYCQLIHSVRLYDDDYAYSVGIAEAEGRRRGWNKALYAAQEAIRNREDGDHFRWVQVEIAVAAIDALRGER